MGNCARRQISSYFQIQSHHSIPNLVSATRKLPLRLENLGHIFYTNDLSLAFPSDKEAWDPIIKTIKVLNTRYSGGLYFSGNRGFDYFRTHGNHVEKYFNNLREIDITTGYSRFPIGSNPTYVIEFFITKISRHAPKLQKLTIDCRNNSINGRLLKILGVEIVKNLIHLKFLHLMTPTYPSEELNVFLQTVNKYMVSLAVLRIDLCLDNKNQELIQVIGKHLNSRWAKSRKFCLGIYLRHDTLDTLEQTIANIKKHMKDLQHLILLKLYWAPMGGVSDAGIEKLDLGTKNIEMIKKTLKFIPLVEEVDIW